MATLTAPSEFDVRAQSVWERWLRMTDAVSVHAALFGDHSPTLGLASQIGTLGQDWAALQKTTSGSAEAITVLDRIEAALKPVEAAALASDASISTASFRQAFSEEKAAYDAVIHYVQFLVSKLDSGDRRDRIEFLATRLVATATGDGRKSIKPRSAVQSVLEAICLGRAVKADVRTNAVKHFEECIQKTQSLTSVDEAFDGGLLLDARGFKLSLGGGLIDPEVLYA